MVFVSRYSTPTRKDLVGADLLRIDDDRKGSTRYLEDASPSRKPIRDRVAVAEIRDVRVPRYLSRLLPDVVVRKDLIDIMLEVNQLLLEPISGYLVGCSVDRRVHQR